MLKLNKISLSHTCSLLTANLQSSNGGMYYLKYNEMLQNRNMHTCIWVYRTGIIPACSWSIGRKSHTRACLLSLFFLLWSGKVKLIFASHILGLRPKVPNSLFISVKSCIFQICLLRPHWCCLTSSGNVLESDDFSLSSQVIRMLSLLGLNVNVFIFSWWTGELNAYISVSYII